MYIAYFCICGRNLDCLRHQYKSLIWLRRQIHIRWYQDVTNSTRTPSTDRSVPRTEVTVPSVLQIDLSLQSKVTEDRSWCNSVAALMQARLPVGDTTLLIWDWLMLYTWLASPVAVCIAKRGRNTRLTWLANPNPDPNLTLLTLHTASRIDTRLAVCIDTFFGITRQATVSVFRQFYNFRLQNIIRTSNACTY